MLFLQIMSGKLPYFMFHHELQVLAAIMAEKPPGLQEHILGAALNDIWPKVELCWLPNPKDRPAAMELDQRLSVETSGFTNLGIHRMEM